MKRGDQLGDTWDCPPHTAAKHELLGKYLDAWFAIFGQSGQGRVLYLDGFAGPGSYKGGEDGSPMLAARRLLNHSAFDRLAGTEYVFAFNEGDSARHAQLCEAVQKLKAEYGAKCHPTCKLWNQKTRTLVSSPMKSSPRLRESD